MSTRFLRSASLSRRMFRFSLRTWARESSSCWLGFGPYLLHKSMYAYDFFSSNPASLCLFRIFSKSFWWFFFALERLLTPYILKVTNLCSKNVR